MESVNHNCNSQNSIEIQLKTDSNIIEDNDKNNGSIKKKIAPFNHLTFFYSIFAFSIFYVILWVAEDKTDLAKTSTIFTYANSIVNTVCWLIYYFTGNSVFLLHGIASFVVSLLAELYYGPRHFPQYMYFFTTYVHHFVFFFIVSIGFWTDLLQYGALGLIIELPTFLLYHKRRYSIKSAALNLMFGVSFLFLRIFYWAWLFFRHPVLSKLVWVVIPCMLVWCVFVYWFILWMKNQRI